MIKINTPSRFGGCIIVIDNLDLAAGRECRNNKVNDCVG